MMQQYRANSYLFGGNAPYVEEMYEAYLDNPASVAESWRAYFDALQHVPATDGSDARDVAHAPVIESFAQRAKANAFGNRASGADLAVARKQVHVQSLIAAYRFLGSRWADLDPLQRTERPKIPELEPAFYDLTESDMDISFSAANTYFSTAEQMTLRQIVQALRGAGHFTVAAVTLPFGFEGAAKRQQAAELIAALQDAAHVVAVMQQDVLLQAFGEAQVGGWADGWSGPAGNAHSALAHDTRTLPAPPLPQDRPAAAAPAVPVQMTVAEATDIADNALEHSVRCILQAVQVRRRVGGQAASGGGGRHGGGRGVRACMHALGR